MLPPNSKVNLEGSDDPRKGIIGDLVKNIIKDRLKHKDAQSIWRRIFLWLATDIRGLKVRGYEPKLGSYTAEVMSGSGLVEVATFTNKLDIRIDQADIVTVTIIKNFVLAFEPANFDIEVVDGNIRFTSRSARGHFFEFVLSAGS